MARHVVCFAGLVGIVAFPLFDNALVPAAESRNTGHALTFRHHLVDPNLRDDALGQTALADVDGDGDLDFITGKSRGTIWWYQYEAPDQWIKRTLGENSPSEVGGAVLDINQDGRIDLSQIAAKEKVIHRATSCVEIVTPQGEKSKWG